MKPKLLAIVGPTAVGKTEIGLAAAQRLDGEIVSADSMQVYRYMDIGTAKPTLEQREQVPHHLIDIIDPDEPFSVADYQARAAQAIEEIARRGRLPMLVGGTGLYIKAIIDGYYFPPVEGDTVLRDRLEALARERGVDYLHSKLSTIDPPSAARIHRNDLRRIIRGLEIFYRTGRTFSEHLRRSGAPPYDLLMVGITMPRQALYERINARVDRMLQQGLLEEVKGLLERGYGPELNSMRGLGYKEMTSYLRGECGYVDAVSALKKNTRNFAKRQLTWFRRDHRIAWLSLGEDRGVQAAVAIIVKLVAKRWESC